MTSELWEIRILLTLFDLFLHNLNIYKSNSMQAYAGTNLQPFFPHWTDTTKLILRLSFHVKYIIELNYKLFNLSQKRFLIHLRRRFLRTTTSVSNCVSAKHVWGQHHFLRLLLLASMVRIRIKMLMVSIYMPIDL